jgi:hypothetical protein
MAADDLKGDDLLREAAKVFDAPSETTPASGGPPQSDETTGTPPTPASPTNVKPDDITDDEDLFREANRILDK